MASTSTMVGTSVGTQLTQAGTTCAARGHNDWAYPAETNVGLLGGHCNVMDAMCLYESTYMLSPGPLVVSATSSCT